MSFFNKWLGSGDKKEGPRKLESPKDLAIGDIVSFKLYAPPALCAKPFEVSEVNTYDFEDGIKAELILKAADGTLVFLSYESDDGVESLCLSQKINRSAVEMLFDLAEFSEILDNEQGVVSLNLRCTEAELPDQLQHLQGFLAATYHRESFSERGYFHKGDFRLTGIPDFAEGEELDYYSVVSADEKHEVEIEVWDDDTDVSITLVTDTQLIEEMWPANG